MLGEKTVLHVRAELKVYSIDRFGDVTLAAAAKTMPYKAGARIRYSVTMPHLRLSRFALGMRGDLKGMEPESVFQDTSGRQCGGRKAGRQGRFALPPKKDSSYAMARVVTCFLPRRMKLKRPG